MESNRPSALAFLKSGHPSNAMIHLRSLTLPAGNRGSGFPFSVPAISTLTEIEFETPVTFFVGENGSGKSTLLESIAIATDLPAVGATGSRDDETLAAQRTLAAALRLAWTQRTHRGFFLRAEDFFGFAKALSRSRDELRRRLSELAVEYKDRSEHARGLAAGPAQASLAEMAERYGTDLDANSQARRSFSSFAAALFLAGSICSTSRRRHCRPSANWL